MNLFCRSNLKSLGASFGLNLRRISLFLILTLGAGLLEGFGTAMFLPVLEFVEKNGDVAGLSEDSRSWKVLIFVFERLGLPLTLLGLILLLLFLILSRVALIYLRQVFTAWLSQEVVHSIRTNLFSRCLKASYSLLDTFKSGHLVNLVTTESQRAMGHLQSLFALTANFAVVAGYFVVLMWVSIPMTLLALVIIGAAGSLVSYYVRHTRYLSHKTTDANQAFSFDLIERLSAFRLIKLTATEEREIRGVCRASFQVRDYNFWLAKLMASVDLILEPVVVLGGLSILYFSIEVFSLSLSQVGLFMLVLMRLLPISKELLRSWQSFLSTSGSMAVVIGGLRDMEEAQETGGGKRLFANLSNGICLKNVTFVYPGQERPALEEVSLWIPAGKMTALVGPSGAGKTTLLDLLVGLRRPQKGQLLIDDILMDEYELGSIRRGVAFVSQDAYIFNDTVRNNISFARLEASDVEIKEAMDQALATVFVRELPQGWDTPLGERGTRLSGGQKQRLSLARALLQKAPVLVLDEATSSLDTEKEMGIQASIQDLRQNGNITIIAIAHRLSTISSADQIIVLDRGKIVERGRHLDLMNEDSKYAEMLRMQMVR